MRLTALAREVLADPLRLPTEADELISVKTQLTALRAQNVLFEKYAEAQDVQRLLCSIDQKLKIVAVREQKKEVQKGRFAEIQAVLGKILADWNAEFDAFLAATETEIRALDDQQNAELGAFDNSLPHELTPQFRKRSQALMEGRDKERALVVNERFAAAQKLKMSNDRAESREAENQFARMQADFERRRERLIARQDDQMKSLVDHAESRRKTLILNRNRLIHGYVRRMNLIDSQLTDSDEPVNLSDERRRMVEDVEAAYPIPLMRPVFAAVKQKVKAMPARVEPPSPEEPEIHPEEEERREAPPLAERPATEDPEIPQEEEEHQEASPPVESPSTEDPEIPQEEEEHQEAPPPVESPSPVDPEFHQEEEEHQETPPSVGRSSAEDPEFHQEEEERQETPSSVDGPAAEAPEIHQEEEERQETPPPE
jgi:hypothetical protein